MKDAKNIIAEALEVLKKGGVILYPTDTVWGLGCDATDPEAVEKIYRIKNRPDSKSLVLLASDLDMVARYVKEIPEMAVQLVEVNDRPMTIIYPDAIAAAAGEPADRHCLAHNVVAEDGTTSANISGEPTPKKWSEISAAVKDAVDYTVDPSLESGATGQSSSIIKVGLDSTIQIIRK